MAATEKLTLAQFLARGESANKGLEYVCGEVVEKTMGTWAHSLIQRLLSVVFTVFLDAHPIGDAAPEVRCIFRTDGEELGRLPDFVFVARERLPAGYLDGLHHGPPDLAVEIWSADDDPGKVLAKVACYLTHGVRLVWLIDPRDRSVTVFAPGAIPRTLSEWDTLDGGDVLPGFAVPVARILPRSV